MYSSANVLGINDMTSKLSCFILLPCSSLPCRLLMFSVSVSASVIGSTYTPTNLIREKKTPPACHFTIVLHNFFSSILRIKQLLSKLTGMKLDVMELYFQNLPFAKTKITTSQLPNTTVRTSLLFFIALVLNLLLVVVCVASLA